MGSLKRYVVRVRALCCFLLAALALGSFAAAAHGPTTTVKVSVGPDSRESDGYSDWPRVSAGARVVTFYSYASTLVDGDTNGLTDVFVHDRTTAETRRVSVSSSGGQANGPSWSQTVDDVGRFVAFASEASNLVPGDDNGAPDVFVHDLVTGETELVSVASDGSRSWWWGHQPDLNADGRVIAWASNARNLVPGDTNESSDVFVRDLRRGITRRASVASDGAQANGHSERPSLSADGNVVAFWSDASNLVSGDTNGVGDVFVHDLRTGATTRVSLASDGTQGRARSWWPALSADGRLVAFESDSAGLVAGDTNRDADIFVHDRVTRKTTRVSVSSRGTEGRHASRAPTISADGRLVAFDSWSDDLAPGDTNESIDAFVHDRVTGLTSRVSLDDARVEADDNSHAAAISPEGAFVAYSSVASNLTHGDANETYDVFVRGPLLLEDAPPKPPAAKPCVVPHVVGLKLAAARTRIRHAGCALGEIRRRVSPRVGRVVRQWPTRGKTLPSRARVRVAVGRAP